MTITVSSLLLLGTNIALTILSLYWSISAWSSLSAARKEEKWTLTQCTIQNTSIVPSTDSQNNNNPDEYCPIITVATNFSSSSASNSVSSVTVNVSSPHNLPETTNTANNSDDDHDTSQCSHNSTAVGQYLEDNYEHGAIVKCWTSPSRPILITLEEVRRGVYPEHVNLAAISTVLAVAAVLSLCAISFLLCIPHPTYVIPDVLATPSSVVRTGLTREAVEAVMVAAEEADANCSGVPSEDRMCAICLEEGLGARLPCNHAYHPQCIKKWLLRGADTCPLCLAVVSPLNTPTSTPTSTGTDNDSSRSLVRTTTLGDINEMELLPIFHVGRRQNYDLNIPAVSMRRLPLGRRTFAARLPPTFAPTTVIRLPAAPISATTTRHQQQHEEGSVVRWQRGPSVQTRNRFGGIGAGRFVNEDSLVESIGSDDDNDDELLNEVSYDLLDDIDVAESVEDVTRVESTQIDINGQDTDGTATLMTAGSEFDVRNSGDVDADGVDVVVVDDGNVDGAKEVNNGKGKGGNKGM